MLPVILVHNLFHARRLTVCVAQSAALTNHFTFHFIDYLFISRGTVEVVILFGVGQQGVYSDPVAFRRSA